MTNVVGLQTDDADHVCQNSSTHVARVVGLQTDAVIVTETRLRTVIVVVYSAFHRVLAICCTLSVIPALISGEFLKCQKWISNHVSYLWKFKSNTNSNELKKTFNGLLFFAFSPLKSLFSAFSALFSRGVLMKNPETALILPGGLSNYTNTRLEQYFPKMITYENLYN